MYRSIFAGFLLLTALFFMIGACAKISSPTGGPRDRQAPVVIKCIPEIGAKNFRGKSLIITFDEYVVLDNVNEKFMVSPPMKTKPRIFIKGKSVNVEFEDELKDSTTYTFYFQDAIKDLNEGNTIEDFQFVLSTGPVIDSLSVTGNVYNSENLEVPEKVMVLMYRNLDDSAVIKTLPDYISRVDQTGYFRINNVRSGKYRLYALKDLDNSKNYNLIDEEFAFMDSDIDVTLEKNFIPVVTDTSTIEKNLKRDSIPTVLTGEHQLLLFAAEKKDHYLSGSSRDLKYRLNYTLSLPPDTMNFEFAIPGIGDDAYFTEASKERDTLKVWLTDSTLYSQQQIETVIKFPFTDTAGMLVYKEDTILMRFLEPRPPRSGRIKKPVYTIGSNIRSGSLKPGEQVMFTSQTPLRQPDTTLIKLYDISDSTSIKLPYSIAKDSTNSSRLFLETELVPNKKYLLIADSASFGSIYNESIDSAGIRFSVKDPESYNKLTFTIQNNDGDLIVELLTNTEKLIRQVKFSNNGELLFPLLEKGTFRTRAIYDLNGDGKWTTGDFDSGRQPEPVSYYYQELEIKPGWDLIQPWDLQLKNVKDQKLKAGSPRSK